MKISNASSVLRFVSHVILSVPTAFLVSFPLLNPNCSSTDTSSIFLSILLKYIRFYLCCLCDKAWIEFCDFQFKAKYHSITQLLQQIGIAEHTF